MLISAVNLTFKGLNKSTPKTAVNIEPENNTSPTGGCDTYKQIYASPEEIIEQDNEQQALRKALIEKLYAEAEDISPEECGEKILEDTPALAPGEFEFTNDKEYRRALNNYYDNVLMLQALDCKIKSKGASESWEDQNVSVTVKSVIRHGRKADSKELTAFEKLLQSRIRAKYSNKVANNFTCETTRKGDGEFETYVWPNSILGAGKKEKSIFRVMDNGHIIPDPFGHYSKC